ncbi:MAG: hypothetical protein ACD_62C00429G0002 [uncultured bacterium]|nr:MAG: hypothetical protein ACD_62C00429G0002 [uncultured bacterium]HLD45082.1 PH domain-containing protein [bacterium]
MSEQESILWQGSPSHIMNFGVYTLCALLCILVVPIFYGLYRWLKLRCFRYELTTERLRTAQGILSRRVDELELYRVKDICILEPFFLRLFKKGNIVLSTSDRMTPDVVIQAVPDYQELREKIRTQVETMRARKGVRELDV